MISCKQSECVMPQLKGLEQLNFHQVQKVILLINLSEKSTRKQCRMLRSLRQNKNKLNQRYPASTTHILKKISNFCGKIEFFEKIKWFCASNITLVFPAWNVSVIGVILVRIFSHSDWIRRDTPYSVSFRIQSECRKIRTRITPNMDTF